MYPAVCDVICYIPPSFHVIYMIKIIHLFHQQMLWIYYGQVVFYIYNRLPLKRDNERCVKENCTHTAENRNKLYARKGWYTEDLKQFFKEEKKAADKKMHFGVDQHVFHDSRKWIWKKNESREFKFIHKVAETDLIFLTDWLLQRHQQTQYHFKSTIELSNEAI